MRTSIPLSNVPFVFFSLWYCCMFIAFSLFVLLTTHYSQLSTLTFACMIWKKGKEKAFKNGLWCSSRQSTLNKYACVHVSLGAWGNDDVFNDFTFFRCQIFFFNFHALLSIDDAPLRCGTIYGVIKAIKIPSQLHLNLNHAIDDDDDNTKKFCSRTLNFDQIIFSSHFHFDVCLWYEM